MAGYAELNKIYKENYNKDLPRATLTRWAREGKVECQKIPPKERKGSQKYEYNLDSFIEYIHSDKYITKLKATRKNPNDYIGKTSGHLLITGIVPKEEYQSDYNGTLMYCKCLNCGKENLQVRFSYLSGNGNYQHTSCGCMRVIRHFLASAEILDRNDPADEEWLLQFSNDWERFSFLNNSILKTTGIRSQDWESKDEYKQFYEHFWNDKQFNILYDNWLNKKDNIKITFYDWWKPSIDHMIPKSKGGTNKIDNLQFLTYYENHNKLDMTWEEWKQFKNETNTTSELYLDAIMKGGDACE